jgi:hypothetical protein
VKHHAPAIENLVRSQDDALGMAAADCGGLFRGETPGQNRRIEGMAPGCVLHSSLVDPGGLGFDGKPCAHEEREPGGAGGGQQQGFRQDPERGQGLTPP